MINIPYGRRNVQNTPVSSGLELTYTSGNAPTKTLAEWNTFFYTSVLATTPFASFTQTGDVITLYGATGLTMNTLLFLNSAIIYSVIDYDNEVIGTQASTFKGSSIVTAILPACTLIDAECFRSALSLLTVECINAITINQYAFNGCSNLETITFPKVVTIGYNVFNNCAKLIIASFPECTSMAGNTFATNVKLTTAYFPKLITTGANEFYRCYILTSINLGACTNLGGTVASNNVFYQISGKIITLTVPHALMTCNGGNPDGDIQALQAANTVTIIYSD